jgi:hypothetical protein
MIPLEDAGKQQQAAASEEPDDDEADTEIDEADDDTLSTVQDKTMAVLVDACRRMLRREQLAQEQQGDLPSEWLAKHRAYCRDVLRLASGILGACLKARPEAVDVAVSLFLDRHLGSREGTPEGKAVELRAYILAAVNAKGAA